MRAPEESQRERLEGEVPRKEREEAVGLGSVDVERRARSLRA